MTGGTSAAEDNMDIKQKRAFRTFRWQKTVKTSSSKGFQDQDVRGMRTNGTSNSR